MPGLVLGWPTFAVKIVPLQGVSESYVTHGCLGPPESTSQTTSRSVQPFLQGTWGSELLHNWSIFPSKDHRALRLMAMPTTTWGKDTRCSSWAAECGSCCQHWWPSHAPDQAGTQSPRRHRQTEVQTTESVLTHRYNNNGFNVTQPLRSSCTKLC